MFDLVRTVFGFPGNFQLAFSGNEKIGRAILVAIGMPANNHGLGPAGDQARDVLTDDRLPEDNTAENISDRSIGRAIHSLETEFFNPIFIGSDRCAFDANAMFGYGVCSIDRDLVIGFIAFFNGKVIISEIDIQIGMNEFIFDKLPDDAGHLIAIKLDNRICYFDF